VATYLKKGDVVICVDDSGYQDGRLRRGSEYTILSEPNIPEYEEGLVGVRWDNGKIGRNCQSRFTSPINRTQPQDKVAGINPKDAIGVKKPSLRFVPMAPVYMMGQAMADGGVKYGPFNWREQPVNASVYYDAALRHMTQWYLGNDRASDSNVHHLAHAMACMAILLDAESQNSLNDDRPKIGTPLDDFIAAHTAH